jgi:actin-related protein
MSWIVFKTGLKKFWTWFKLYWYVPIIIILAIMLLLMGKTDSVDKIKDLMQVKKNSFKREVETLETFQKLEEEMVEKSTENYHETIQKIEEKYKKETEEITKKEKKMAKDLTSELKNNPSDAVRKIAEEMGWEYVE